MIVTPRLISNVEGFVAQLLTNVLVFVNANNGELIYTHLGMKRGIQRSRHNNKYCTMLNEFCSQNKIEKQN